VPNKEELTRWCWEQGILAWFLHKGQMDIYERQMALPQHGVFVSTCARQFGKTLGELVFMEEFARRNHDAIIRFAAPTHEMAKVIVLPVWEEILNGLHKGGRACPPDLRPRYRAAESCWIYPSSGTRVYLAGTDLKENRLRGAKAHLVVIDEAGFHNSLDTVIDTILGPQLDSTEGKMLISSTPPDSLDHPFVDYKDQAERDGWAVKKTIFDNPMRSPADIRAICRRSNRTANETDIDLILAGKMQGSPSWQREYLCEMVTNRDLRVIPEFDPQAHVREHPRPNYFQPYVFIDFGFHTDYSAALFGYLDFSLSLLHIEDEYVARRLNSRELAVEMVKKERALWGAPARHPVRFADHHSAQQIYDMQSIFDYPIAACSKRGGLEGMVNNLREMIGADRLSVNPRCQHLVKQLREGIWKKDKHGQINSALKFERTESMGHLDCIAALMYGAGSIDWRRNPVPAGQINHYTHFYLGKDDGFGLRPQSREIGRLFDQEN